MFDPILQNPLAFAASVFILSLCIGSFLNVVAYRIPIMLKRDVEADYLALTEQKPKEHTPFNLMVPNSACPSCGSAIKAWQNIPVISYLLLKGKCANCSTKISMRYPIVEFVTGLLGLMVAVQFGPTMQTAGLLVFTYFLVALTLIDFDEYLLPDNITIPLIWIGLLFNVFNTYTTLENAVFGAVAGYLSLWSIYWLFKLLTGKEGMGFGDFKLLAAIGAFLGWQTLPVVILMSSAVGAVVGITLIIALGRDKNIPIPFGPYLAAAGWISAMWGEQLIDLYLRMSGIR